MQMLSPTGLLVRFAEGAVALNSGGESQAQRARLALNSFPVSVSGWSGHSAAAGDGQRVFSGAGEYECHGLRVRGYGCETDIDGTSLQTTSWLIHGDGIDTLVLGGVVDGQQARRSIGEVDTADLLVVFCPVSGVHLEAQDITALAAEKSAAKIVLLGDDTDTLREAGDELGDPVRIEGRYVVKKKDLAGEAPRVILLG